MARGRLLVADELGAGKTITALCMIANPECRPAVVVTLTDLPPQWAERMREFTPDFTFRVLRTGASHGNADRKKVGGWGAQDLAGDIERGWAMPDVILMSYSKLVGWAEWLAEAGIKSITFDEIQELRTGMHVGGKPVQKYHSALRVVRSCEYAMGLSATPIYNYGAEVYNVLTVLEPDAFGSKEEFSREWTTTNGAGKVVIAQPDVLGHYLREQGYMIRRTVTEITGREISKPTSIVQRIDADLDVLNKMASDAESLARVIVSQGGHSNTEKWKAAGDFDYKLRHATGVAKARYVAAFARLILESEDKLLIFAWHHDVYAILKQHLHNYNPVFLYGQVSPPERQKAIKEFCDGDARVMVMSLRAGAGIDGLQKQCRVAVFAELDWSPRVHDQCLGRIHRPGQMRDVLAYYLITEHGSDPVICDALGVKNMMSHAILNPDAPLVEPLQTSGSNIKSLAESYLAKLGSPQSESAA
jgi:SNF2 family DNA or RNA helicase